MDVVVVIVFVVCWLNLGHYKIAHRSKHPMSDNWLLQSLVRLDWFGRVGEIAVVGKI